MRVLVTFAGRAGDLLWALPTVRALSRRLATPVDLWIAGEFAALLPLLQQQAYLGTVYADPAWAMAEANLHPHIPVREQWDTVIHLGYKGWPSRPLAQETLHTFNEWAGLGVVHGPLTEADLDLHTPWITVDGPGPPTEIVWGWSETHFELKVGLTLLVQERIARPHLVISHSAQSRWVTERPIGSYPYATGGWVWEAKAIRNADLFIGCNSGLHVLAAALGTPVVMVEPMEARWNPIFFPLGTTGPQITLVRGTDGNPTFDARHVADAIEARCASLS